MSDNNDWNAPPGAPPGADSLPGEGEGWGDEHEPQALHDVDNQQWGVAPPPSGPPTGPPMPGNDPGVWPPPAGGPPAGGPPGGPPAGGPPVSPQSPYGHQQPQGQMMRPPPTGMQSSSGQLDNNDAIALAANFFIPGVGYFLLGQSQKGIATILLTFFTCGLSYLAVIVLVYDAYMVALARKNRPVGEWEFFPK